MTVAGALMGAWSFATPLPALAAGAPAAPAARMAVQAFGDWLYRCQQAPTPESKPVCEVAQEMVVRRDGKPVPVMTMAFARDAKGRSHHVTILAPLGIGLKDGIAIAGDNGRADSFKFDYCDQRGCWVSGGRADAVVSALRHAKGGRARFAFANGHTITLNFSVTGFDAALAALDAGKPPEPRPAETSDAAASAKTRLN